MSGSVVSLDWALSHCCSPPCTSSAHHAAGMIGSCDFLGHFHAFLRRWTIYQGRRALPVLRVGISDATIAPTLRELVAQ